MRVIVIVFFLLSCNSNNSSSDKYLDNSPTESQSKAISFVVTKQYKHDTTSFTEGLVFNNRVLFESTGSPDNLPLTKSIIGSLDLNTGKINTKISLDRNIYFGEGITFLKNKLYQLTYKNRLGFIYNAKNFTRLDSFHFANEEGWGLTTDGNNLIISDGSDKLTFISPITFKIIKILDVKENGLPVDQLNELEYINNFIYSNIYTTKRIIKIDPNTGNVVGFLDLTFLADDAKTTYGGSLEMNGIAYDSIKNAIYITGKMWPKVYELLLN